ncbi:RNA polymerase sigma factor SigJ [Allobranchiibius sp. GilTou38]|nr:RNA polymerase sigma factor SigJ [Allobranchiibius sp. GilTou38]
MGKSDQTAHQVEGERRHLVNLAYRLLGSLAEAEDAVQDGYTRWFAMTPQERARIVSPGAWLTTVVSRICLDVLGSARARRERYVGAWIPEPVPVAAEWSASDDPADRITLDESVTMALLIVLDVMTPAERVAFVLHDVFGYPFADVADIVGRTPAACRQLASSARRRIGDTERAAAPDPSHPRVVRDFSRAWQRGDIRGLVELLDPDATVVADGGGLVTASLDPIVGAGAIARFLHEIISRSDITLLERTVNSRPGLVAQQDGVTVTVFAFRLDAGRISRIWAIRNPDKLTLWGPSGEST